MTNQAHFETYPQRRQKTDGEPGDLEPTGQYGWRFKAANGQISAVGGEGFTSRAGAEDAIHSFIRAVTGVEPHPPILDADE